VKGTLIRTTSPGWGLLIEVRLDAEKIKGGVAGEKTKLEIFESIWTDEANLNGLLPRGHGFAELDVPRINQSPPNDDHTSIIASLDQGDKTRLK
jgi:hypothetical protein